MMDILKKVVKPIATGILIVLGMGAAATFTDPKNWFHVNVEYPTGPCHEPESWGSKDPNEVIVLHADELRQLRWMTVSQLNAIFGARRGKFKVENSQAAYQELRWMSTAQLNAIFGTNDIHTNTDA